MSISIAECRAAGVVFEAEEAVAIAQQLMTSLRDPQNTDEVQSPFGPPSAANVFLQEDGSVICRGCRMTPVVSEIAIFLDGLLHEGATRIPGGLRYTMARALLDVDVPPFNSLDDFSRDLARHERGNRSALVQRAVARTSSADHDMVPVRVVDRRKSQVSATALRRELREADARLYQRREAMKSESPSIDMVAVSQMPHKGRTRTATAACVAAGLVLIGAGELMHKDRAPDVPPATTVAQTLPLLEPSQRIAPSTIPIIPEAGIIAIQDTTSKPTRASRPEVRRVSLKRSSSTGSVGRRAARRAPHRNVWDRLKLGWLRNAFTSRSSL